MGVITEMDHRRKPTRDELAAAVDRTVPDLIQPNLTVLFVGINPGLYTAAIGHHFGRPGNRFWKALDTAGFTPRLFSPDESDQLLDLGYGITNIVPRATLRASDLTSDELLAGKDVLVAKILKYKPEYAAILGIESYRKAFAKKDMRIGLQDDTIGSTRLWVLPNPSGLNAHFTPQKLTEVFLEFKNYIDKQ
jgi:TDG/mug DNA glycosylase family protein